MRKTNYLRRFLTFKGIFLNLLIATRDPPKKFWSFADISSITIALFQFIDLSSTDGVKMKLFRNVFWVYQSFSFENVLDKRYYDRRNMTKLIARS